MTTATRTSANLKAALAALDDELAALDRELGPAVLAGDEVAAARIEAAIAKLEARRRATRAALAAAEATEQAAADEARRREAAAHAERERRSRQAWLVEWYQGQAVDLECRAIIADLLVALAEARRARAAATDATRMTTLFSRLVGAGVEPDMAAAALETGGSAQAYRRMAAHYRALAEQAAKGGQ